MIRRTLAQTQAATFAVELPSPGKKGLPVPHGTGFFISPEGWFLTAAHVVSVPNRVVRGDIEQAWIKKESRGEWTLGMYLSPRLDWIDHDLDIALLKLDEDKNQERMRTDAPGFPSIKVSTRILEEGEPVYSFGYPLSESALLVDSPDLSIGHTGYAPRVTSAVVASTLERSELVGSPGAPSTYVLDKALNYGNSGGPIVASGTGHAHGLCIRYQPVTVPQKQWKQPGKPMPFITVPSLYGVVLNLSQPKVVQEFQARGIELLES